MKAMDRKGTAHNCADKYFTPEGAQKKSGSANYAYHFERTEGASTHGSAVA